MLLYTQACCITCSNIAASVKLYMSPGLGIFSRVNISLCFSLKVVQSLGKYSIKMPHSTS